MCVLCNASETQVVKHFSEGQNGQNKSSVYRNVCPGRNVHLNYSKNSPIFHHRTCFPRRDNFGTFSMSTSEGIQKPLLFIDGSRCNGKLSSTILQQF